MIKIALPRYNVEFVAVVRRLDPSAQWDAESKTWTLSDGGWSKIDRYFQTLQADADGLRKSRDGRATLHSIRTFYATADIS